MLFEARFEDLQEWGYCYSLSYSFIVTASMLARASSLVTWDGVESSDSTGPTGTDIVVALAIVL
jgi:hypothetical protein